MDRLISVAEAASILGVTDVWVLRRISQGTLLARQLSGKGWMVSLDSARGKRASEKKFSELCGRYVSVPQACEIVCVTDGMIGRMLASGILKGFRLNKKAWAVCRESCEKNIREYLASPKKGGRPRVLSGKHAPKKRVQRHHKKIA